MNSLFQGFTAALLLIFLTACATPKERAGNEQFVYTRVDLVANYDANNTHPILVDLVFVYDEEFLGQLETMTARQWFEYREGNAGIPEEQAFWLTNEIAPGKSLTITDFPDSKNTAMALVIFADYDFPGVHRFIVGDDRMVNVRLMEDNFVVTKE